MVFNQGERLLIERKEYSDLSEAKITLVPSVEHEVTHGAVPTKVHE